MPRHLLLLVLLASAPSLADRRAFSVDIAGAWSAGSVAAVQTTAPQSTFTMGPAVWLGARYGLTHHLELSLTGFFETPVTVGHNTVVLRTANGDFSGTLVHQTMRVGGVAGVRYVFGMVVRFHVGVELGWSQRLYTNMQMVDDRDPSNVIDYGLSLPDTSRGNFVISPVLALEWAAGDHWSLAFVPRAQFQLGKDGGWAVLLPLQVSWSWFI